MAAVVKNKETASAFITPRDMAKIVNAHYGQGDEWVRWSDEFNCFVTMRGDLYLPGTIEDVYKGIKQDKE